MNIVSAEKVKATRERIAAKFAGESLGLTPLQRLLKWSVMDLKNSTISPFCNLTVAVWIEDRIGWGTVEGLRAAILVDPANARLAAHFGKAIANYALGLGTSATDPNRGRKAMEQADFQTRRAIKLAPDNGEVRKLRTEVVKLLQLPE